MGKSIRGVRALMKARKGLTLIELVVAIAIAAMLGWAVMSILPTGIHLGNKADDEFNRQADIRVAMLNVNTFVRYSTAAFAITEDKYRPKELEGSEYVTRLTKGWNYFGVSPDGAELVHYQYDEKSMKHIKEVIVPRTEGLTYAIQFKKQESGIEDKMLRFTVACYKNGQYLFDYDSEIEALNALQVISQGDPSKPAVALAYRADTRPVAEQVYGAVTMVLDMSGSMNARMDGSGRNDNYPPRDARINILKMRATELVDALEYSYVNLVPFSTSANNPGGFYNIDNASEKNYLKQEIQNLRAQGATNTGDGMRRGYYQLQSFNHGAKPQAIKNAQIKNYMVILVDGATNIGTMQMKAYSSYQGSAGYLGRSYYYWYDESNRFYPENTSEILANGNLKRNLDLINYGPFYCTSDWRKSIYDDGKGIKGNPWAGDETTEGNHYVQLVGQNLIQGKSNYENLGISTFVIGFSSKRDDLASVANIARATGISVSNQDINNDFKNHDRVYIATDSEGLQKAFDSIGGIIKTELWQVWGPEIEADEEESR